MASPLKHDRAYSAGEVVRVSGIYRVRHDEHRPDHTVTAVRGDEFPPCRKCGMRVTFTMIADADYVNHDWDLAGPAGLQIVR